MKNDEIIKEDIIIMDGNIKLMNKALTEKKVVLAAIELGKHAQHTIAYWLIWTFSSIC
ncbi:hypothetical protein [Spiroplasma ixodetis]|uniref:hypothetical protein n=1 Tax=Spiroplasma ixodetis TaxID=2141 RepID=UPI0025768F09|nr:hypothetical protein [Spiroplasma ixodetis]WJG70716.1 hypothetical protein SIXOD_v1c19330 [Spiroplasma ixodetis Y32]